MNDGGGIVIFGSENSQSQNKLLITFGAEFNALAKHPLKPFSKVAQIEIEGAGGSSLAFDNKDN